MVFNSLNNLQAHMMVTSVAIYHISAYLWSVSQLICDMAFKMCLANYTAMKALSVFWPPTDPANHLSFCFFPSSVGCPNLHRHRQPRREQDQPCVDHPPPPDKPHITWRIWHESTNKQEPGLRPLYLVHSQCFIMLGPKAIRRRSRLARPSYT